MMQNARRVALLCALAIAGQAMADESGAGWIGKIVPPYPEGVTETSGTCIGDAQADDAQLSQATICDHALAVLDDPQSKLRTILALEQAPHFGKLPLWRVVDALEPDELGDRNIQVATGTCQQHGTDDATVVALVRVADQEWLAPVLSAWRFDVAAGRLLPVAVADIRCRNEGFGYDG